MASTQNLVPIQPVWSMHCQFDAVNFCQFMTATLACSALWKGAFTEPGLGRWSASSGASQASSRPPHCKEPEDRTYA